jgi:hypothetical protein
MAPPAGIDPKRRSDMQILVRGLQEGIGIAISHLLYQERRVATGSFVGSLPRRHEDTKKRAWVSLS